ncbi:alpha/beta hydrolase [Aggregatibacter aphrophilus]|uniref:alpha/beta hydrolase n=1 Tax=Aggregatibacter aphrophilus TaxID=732 RepID=UPI000D652759|nr:alpha/beta hydrolase [Aggregatibacter aphrophilus]
MTSITGTAKSFTNKHQSEKIGTGTDACRTTVVIYHRDTLGKDRKLPANIVVMVYDESGKPIPAAIDKSGYSTHLNVRCGKISWQLVRGPYDAAGTESFDKSNIERKVTDKSESFQFGRSDGYVLVEANGVKNKDPREQFIKPLKISVSRGQDGKSNVTAIYLPPPMLLNLRFKQKLSSKKRKEEINKIVQQVNADGKSATLFIHGFNVPLGAIGRFPSPTELGENPAYDSLKDSRGIQAPYLYYGDIIGQRVRNVIAERRNFYEYSNRTTGGGGRDIDAQLKSETQIIFNSMDTKFNGKDALAWFPTVEYYLNLAASGATSANTKLSDWKKYSRIIGVTWSGSVDPSRTFFRAEIYANEAGRKLAKDISTLLENNIQVNIITHSLGARVALAALNILGDANQPKKIKNLIMLEAAVADNAITANYTREKNPVAMELFPFAHKAAEYVRVMYSQEDGVLGPDNSLLDLDDGLASDISRGAYPLKYGVIAGKTNAFGDYYPHGSAINNQRANAQSESVQAQCKSYIKNKDQRFKEVCDYILKNQPSISKAQIENELKALIQNEMKMVNDDWQTELKILRPWSHFRRFPENEDYVKHITDILMTMVFRNTWKLSSKELEIRPALGHVGDKFTAPDPKEKIDKNLAKEYPTDNFISGLKNKQFSYHDQSDYFTSHSAIKDLIWEEMTLTDHQRKRSNPTRFSRIYRETYKDQIMDKYIKNFGRY